MSTDKYGRLTSIACPVCVVEGTQAHNCDPRNSRDSWKKCAGVAKLGVSLEKYRAMLTEARREATRAHSQSRRVVLFVVLVLVIAL